MKVCDVTEFNEIICRTLRMNLFRNSNKRDANAIVTINYNKILNACLLKIINRTDQEPGCLLCKSEIGAS